MPYDFGKIKIIQSFGRHIWNGIITLYDLYEELKTTRKKKDLLMQA